MERFGQYILLEKVASGGMAELFKAKKLGIAGFERVLAIKRILPHLSSDEEFIDMFIAEAKLVARLSHKNIAQVYDFGKIGQNYFIAMEYVKGRDLRGILKRSKARNAKLPTALAVFIAKEIASALGYAHKQKDSMGKNLNIIHRDVSPQNILISYEGDVKVVDFGIAKAGAHSKTTTGVLKGKLSYMSPEQAWGKTIDHRSDIFSLGVVLYETLTGERLFKGDSELNTLERVREARVEPLPSVINTDLPSELEAKLLKALTKEAAERYQDASDMEAAMNDSLFKLLPGDPVAPLKEFMHSLFKAEIEAEQKSEMEEETVRVQFEEEHIETKRDKRPKEPEKKRKKYLYAIAASLAVVIAALFVFWPYKAEKTDVLNPSQPVIGNNSSENQLPLPAVPQDNQASASSSAGEKNPAPVADKQDENDKTKKAAEDGALTVNAMPWANVYINGKSYGTTPKTIEGLQSGTYRVRLENPNFSSWETKVNIASGQTAKVAHKFGGFGKLVVNASPWADVYLDGVLKGQTPLTIERISGGKHQIRIVREGFAEFTKTISMGAEATEQLSVSLKREGE